MVITRADSSQTSYSEVTKRLKESVDLDFMGVKVTELRYAKSGSITMSVEREADAVVVANMLRVALEAVLGADAGVRVHCNALHLLILGISLDDDPTDVQDELTREGMPPLRK